jgi:hypothetical protein
MGGNKERRACYALDTWFARYLRKFRRVASAEFFARRSAASQSI